MARFTAAITLAAARLSARRLSAIIPLIVSGPAATLLIFLAKPAAPKPTIIINGNLHINKNLYYESNAVTAQIENLASVAWIVRGDVIIDGTVSNVVGDFIVVGPEPAVACADPRPSGCGEFRTGADADSPRQLVLSGLVMAREMFFERSFRLAGEPAEKIIYDGRVIVNTPPGLENVAKGLPLWRESTVSADFE